MPTIRAVLTVVGGVGLLGLLWLLWQVAKVEEREVRFQSGEVQLAGTVLIPRFADFSNGVVLVHGSGETSRNSMMTYGRVFASKGYPALFYDKRGVGDSEGQKNAWREFSIQDLANDAMFASQHLAKETGLSEDKIGFFATSQGAWIVAQATELAEPAFMVMVSASVSTIAEDRVFGRYAQVLFNGHSEKEASDAANLLSIDHEVTRGNLDYLRLHERWNSSKQEPWFKGVYGDDSEPPLANSPERTWERSILDFDPVPFLEKTNAPSLWIYGDPKFDRFAPVAKSIERLNALRDSGKNITISSFEGADHNLKLPNESDLYAVVRVKLPATIEILDWLQSVRNGI